MDLTPQNITESMATIALEAAGYLSRDGRGRLSASVYYLVAENERLRASSVVTLSSPVAPGGVGDVSAAQGGGGGPVEVTTVGDDTQVTTPDLDSSGARE